MVFFNSESFGCAAMAWEIATSIFAGAGKTSSSSFVPAASRAWPRYTRAILTVLTWIMLVRSIGEYVHFFEFVRDIIEADAVEASSCGYAGPLIPSSKFVVVVKHRAEDVWAERFTCESSVR